MLVEFVGQSQFLFTCENGKCGSKAVTSSPDKLPTGWGKVRISIAVIGPEERPEGFEGTVCDKCVKKWKRMVDDSHEVKKGRRK